MTPRRKDRERGAARGGPLELTRWTGIYGAAGVATALAGFFLLQRGSLVVAPLLLTVAFVVFLPLALVK